MDDHHTAGLEDRLLSWEAAGLLSPEQRVAISAFEARQSIAQPVEMQNREGLSVLAELGIYLGLVLVIASGALATSRLWERLGTPGRAAIGLVVIALSLLTSQMLRRESSTSLTRLRHVLESGGTAGAAMTTAVLADAAGNHHPTTTLFMTGLVVMGSSGIQWRNRERTLALLGTLAGLAMTAGATFSALDLHISPLVGGGLLVLVGAAAMVGAQTVLRPRLTLTVVGQVVMFFGALAICPGHLLVGALLGLVAAGIGVAVGIRTKANVVTAVGLLCFAVFTLRLLSMYVRGPLAILITFFLGIGVVVFVLRKGLGAKNKTTEE